ncbi:MAG: cardiolipin synthase [Candidatus Nomurabacteria bacterium]|nr:cardiolipin synthase [Candidatus Nomurabacteria bacterium]
MKQFTFSESLSIEDLPATFSQLTGSSIITGGSITILNNGDEFFPALYTDIKNAKISIELSVYIWKKGVVSNTVFDLLIQKAREGVRVRIILDSFGGKAAPQDKIAALRAAGGMVGWYHPFKIGLLLKFFKRNHTRAIIIDNAIAYTGGMAIADYWQGNALNKYNWRDMMFRMTGPIITSIQHTFSRIWASTTGEIIIPSAIESSNKNNEGIQSVAIVNDSPDQDMEQLTAFFATTIAATKISLDIATPYLILQPRLKKQLIAAAQRGVAIRLLLPGKYIDSKIVQAASQNAYGSLLGAGIKIYEYKPTMIHSKLMIADGIWSIIGSANIDTRSSFYNVENNIGIMDQTFATHLQDLFNIDLKKAYQINAKRWQRRFILRKISEIFAAIPDDQF